jgi:hypothetical protein
MEILRLVGVVMTIFRQVRPPLPVQRGGIHRREEDVASEIDLSEIKFLHPVSIHV